jgi:hypothetical protein
MEKELGCSSVVEYLLSMLKALGSIPSTKKREQKEMETL